MFSRILALVLLLPTPFLSKAATFYVAKTGDDTNPGTQAQPFLTLKKGLTMAQPGDTLKIGAGEYPEIVNTVRSGEPGQYITIDGQGAASVRKFNLNHPYHKAANISVSGYTNRFSALITLGRNAHYSVVSNVVVDASSALDVAGISWTSPSTRPFGHDAASNCLIISNRITGMLADTAINIFGDNNLILGNYVHDLGQSDFVRLWGRSNIVRANTFTNIVLVPGVGNHIDFIQTFGENGFGSLGHIIENNLITSIAGGQLSQLETYMVPDIRDWTFRNNVFADIALQASCTVPGVKYYNNVFYRCNLVNGGHALNFGQRSYGELGTSVAHGVEVKNNVFLDCGTPGATNKGWYSFDVALTNVVADYNYVAKDNYSRMRAGSLAIGTGNHDNFKFYEPHGINGGDPNFSLVSVLDFRLRPGSFLIDAGTSITGLHQDFFGMPRPQENNFDVGVHEFTKKQSINSPGNLRFVQK